MSARKSRIVHMFAFVALVANLFAPVLTLPVTAEDLVSDPVVTTSDQNQDTTGQQSTPDTDGDGVLDDADLCIDAAAVVDANQDGCEDEPPPPPEPIDSDGDGVTDNLDQCLDVAAVVDVDGDGCEDAPPPPVDSDGDGVTDDLDQCIDVAAVIDVDGDGCEDAPPPPVDSDGDGVTDDLDQCIDVAASVDVDGDGCEDAPPPPVDSDGDGVTDDLDQCIDVAAVVDVDGDGCEDAPPPPVDSDGDGVTDDLDQCVDVAAVVDADKDGCDDAPVVEEPVVEQPGAKLISVLPVDPVVEGCGELVITTDPTADTGITYAVTPNEDGSYTVSATIDASTHEWGAVVAPWSVSDGVATFQVVANPCPPDVQKSSGPDMSPMTFGELKITKSANKTTYAPGETITWTVKVENHTGTGVKYTLSDSLGSGTWSNTDGCSVSGLVITCDGELNTLGYWWSSRTYTFNSVATSECGAEIANTATITSYSTWIIAWWEDQGAGPSTSISVPVGGNQCKPSLEIAKTASVTSVEPGVSFTYTVSVFNGGNAAEDGYSFTDKIPAGLELISVSAGCTPASGTGAVDVTCTGANLGSNQTHSYTFQVQANGDQCGSVTNTAKGKTGEWNKNKKEAQKSVTVICDSKITITKTADKAVYAPGETITWTITIHNGHQAAINFVDWQDVFPAGLVTPGNVIQEPNPGNPTCGWVGSTLTCTDFTVPSVSSVPNNTAVFQVTTVISETTCDTTIQNNATVLEYKNQSKWYYDDINSNIAEVTVLPCEPNISVAKVGSLINEGGKIKFEITLTNSGLGDANDVSITDTLPVGLRDLPWWSSSATGICGSVDVGSGEITCTGITVPKKVGDTNGVVTITLEAEITATSPVCGTYTNTVEWELSQILYRSGTLDATTQGGQDNPPPIVPPTSGEATGDVTIPCVQSYTWVKYPEMQIVGPDGNISWSLTVTNNGNTLISDVQITDPLPALPDGALWSVSSASGMECVDGKGLGGLAISEVDCTFTGILDPEESFTLTISATLPISINVESAICGDYTNIALLSASSWDFVGLPAEDANDQPLDITDAASNEATLSVECPGIDVEKIDGLDGASALPGSDITYQITVTNTGYTTLSGYQLVDSLPVGVDLWESDLPEECAYDSGAHKVTCDVPDLAVNSEPYEVAITVNVPTDITAAMCDGLINTVRVDPQAQVIIQTVGPPALPSDEASVETSLDCEEGYTFTKLAPIWETGPGGELKYVITLKNEGKVDITSATITDDLPELPEGGEWTYQTTGPIDCTLEADGVSLSCDLNANLVPEASVTVTVSAQVPDELTLTDEGNEWCTTWVNTATVSGSYSTFVNPENEVKTFAYSGQFGDTTLPRGIPVNCTGIHLEKSGPALVAPGASMSYQITVTNLGTTWISSLVVEDEIDPRLENVTATLAWEGEGADHCGFDLATRIVSCTIPYLPLSESVTITISADVIAMPTVAQCDDLISNTANITSYFVGIPSFAVANREITIPQDGNIPSNQVDTKIDCQPEIDLQKTGPEGAVQPGEDIVFTLTATNIGSYPAMGLSITDTLPEGLDALSWMVTFSPDDTGASCEQTGATIQCEGVDLDAYDGELIITLTASTTSSNPVCGVYTNKAIFTDANEDQIRFADADIACVPNYEVVKSSDLTTDADGNAVISEGDTITYTISIANTGNMALTGLSLTDTFSGFGELVWPDGVDIASLPTIDAGAVLDIPTTYVVTQEDVLAGNVQNCALMSMAVEGQDPLQKESCVVDQIQQTPALTLAKTSAEASGDNNVLDPEELITYTFTVTNTGETTLSNVEIADPMPGLTWGDDGNIVETLPVGESVDLTATYVVTQADIDNGGVENCARAMGVNPDESDVNSNESCDSVEIEQTPGITVVKTGASTSGTTDSLEVDDVITYTFVVTNTGNVTLSTVTISDPMPGLTWSEEGNGIDTLAPGVSVERTATYTVVQSDVQYGEVTNCASMTSEAPNGTAVSSDQSCDTLQTLQTLELAMVQECPGDLQPFDPQVDQEAGFQLTITNSGNVSVSNIVVTASREGTFNEPFPTTFAPGQSETRTWTIVMTAEDIETREVHAEFTVIGDVDGDRASFTASMVAMQSAVGTVAGTLTLDCPMVPSVQPVPTVTPEPTATPPATPVPPATPEPTATAATAAPVSQLPDTGFGVAATASVIWAAVILSAFVLGASAAGLRKFAKR